MHHVRGPRSFFPDVKIEEVVFEEYAMKPAHASPYPLSDLLAFEGTSANRVERLFVCRNCFKYTTRSDLYINHFRRCDAEWKIPGVPVYDDGHVRLQKIDGIESKLYCQNLCQFAKLFIEHKYIFFETSNFVFYVLFDNKTPMAFFSKERIAYENLSLNCIVTFPPYRGRRHGTRLIELSYALAKPGGTPERPLSEDGERTYVKYWGPLVAAYVQSVNKEAAPVFTAPLSDISSATGIRAEDIVLAVEKYPLGVQGGGLSQEERAALGVSETTLVIFHALVLSAAPAYNKLLNDKYYIRRNF